MKVKESRILRMLPLNKKFIDSLLRAAQCFSGFCNLEHSFPTRRKILKSDASVVQLHTGSAEPTSPAATAAAAAAAGGSAATEGASTFPIFSSPSSYSTQQQQQQP
ncbi:hypothetical protein PGTUg99_014522 [Puccinia graminis f. sp. tritici]|uniref:Uncharacterized protein n=1 Tax=Puccinia graminis f. sp. tritici TaxID=56615 RepID=A0A5B0S3R4_PUCGR|nr:hypothetical protein PGTUg99_014522 [Puccinia graminis f. sp. tritici]